MKKATFEIVKIDVKDVITTSGLVDGGTTNPGGEGSGNIGGWASQVNVND